MIMQGAKPVISYYNGSIYNALFDLFPEIGLDKSKCLSCM